MKVYSTAPKIVRRADGRSVAVTWEIVRYIVPTSLELEDRTEREAIVWALLPH